MKTLNRTLLAILFMALAIPGFSQDTSTSKTDKKNQPDATKEEPRADGLRKISTRSIRDRDFDIHIDHEALGRNIEVAIENAMKSVDVALGKLEKLELNIEPIEINLKELNDLDPIVVNIPDLNINIDPIEVNMPELPDLDIDHEHFHWNHDEDNDEDHDENMEDNDEDHHHSLNKDDSHNHDKHKGKEKQKEKNKVKDKSDKEEKEKAKGLKKLN